MGDFFLENISFEISTGEFGILMGRTGCGKTTVLEIICGLKRPDSGTVMLGGQDVTLLRAAERGVGYVPQDGALFPTMTVYDHLALALKIRKYGRTDIERQVKDMAELLDIAHLLGRKPHGLSGGESQRVALGRALTYKPEILCLDEPLSALDDKTKDDMCNLLSVVCERTGVTTLYVTHNLSEVSRLADLVFRFKKGQIVKIDGLEKKQPEK